jgi:ribose transport system permease protein
MAMADMVARLRYKYLPDHMVGEILSKRWIDSARMRLIPLSQVGLDVVCRGP